MIQRKMMCRWVKMTPEWRKEIQLGGSKKKMK
jgi:hypothetical protein